jgi:hypothetical protein
MQLPFTSLILNLTNYTPRRLPFQLFYFLFQFLFFITLTKIFTKLHKILIVQLFDIQTFKTNITIFNFSSKKIEKKIHKNFALTSNIFNI